ncbi:MAG: lipid A deacylase LpxR family protein [Bacteroidota bacterium]
MRIFFTLAFIITSTVLPAQDRLIRLTYDNDFFSATDRYYTQGVRLEYIAPVFQKSPVNHILFKDRNAQLFAGIAIERDGFTPGSIRIDTIPIGNRPYAATSFLSSFVIAVNQETHTKLTSQFDVGIIGPASGGKEEQTAIHNAINGLPPLGWQYQVANDVVLNYMFQYEKGIVNNEYFQLAGLTQARLGTLFTDASAGALIRVGFMNDYFSNLGITAQNGSRKFQVYGFAKATGKAVGYNATMQGGLFNESIYTLKPDEINRTTAQAFYGIVIAYKRFQLEYTKAHITKEFKNGVSHGWGHCAVSFCF